MATTVSEAPPRATPPSTRSKKPRSSLNPGWLPWIMLAPAIILLGGVILYPAGNALWLSLTSTNLLNTAQQQFIGLDNFTEVFADDEFYRALRNTAIWTVGSVGAQLALGMAGALILNSRIRARGAVRGLVLIPWATPSVLVALMWMWMLDPNLGIINHILQLVGLQENAYAWLANPGTALPTLMFVDIWQGVPFFAVMILAALQGVPHTLLEAAKIDGANAWQTFWRVVLPLIGSTILITTILRLIWTANYFDLILILTNGGPANATLTLPLLAYHTAYRGFDFGLAAAFGVTQAVILAVLVVFYVRQVRRNELV
ncbi:sugar ABC transporter permease [Angustibacter speluncae]